MDQEQITVELDDRPAKAAVERTNAGLDSIEKKSATVVDNMSKQWELQARTVINVVDRSKNAVDRYLTSLNKQAAAYGKTNEIERLIALRDTSIAKYKDEQRAVDGITASYDKMIAKAQQAAVTSYENQAALYKRTGVERLEAQRDIELRQYASPEQEPVRRAIRQSYGQMIDLDRAKEEKAAVDAQRESVDRLVASLERENFTMGRSGIDRLIGERDHLLQQYNDEQRAVDAINAHYGNRIALEKQRQETAAIEQQKLALDQLLGSLEKEAALAGKSPIQRQIAERQMLLKEWQHEPAAVNALTASLRRLEDEERRAAQVHGNVRRLILGAKDLAEGYSRGAIIEGVDYLMSLRGGGHGRGGGSALAGAAAAGGGMETAEGGVAAAAGISAGAIISFAGIAAALGAVEIAGFKAQSSLAEYGRQIENIHLRTGIATENVEAFAFAAKAAGQNVDVYQHAMRSLTEAVSENSREGDKARATLKALGVDLHDALRSPEQMLLDVARGLNNLPPGFQRTDAALKLFRESGMDIIPVLKTLQENVDWFKAHGLGSSPEEMAQWAHYEEKLSRASAIWASMTRHAKEYFAEIAEASTLMVSGELPGMAIAEAFDLTTPEAPANAERDLLQQHRERRQADALIRSSQSDREKNLEYRLRQAEERLSKDAKPELGITPLADVRAYNADFARVEQLKAQVKAVQQLREEESRLQEFERRMNERNGSYLHIPTDASGNYLPVPKGRTSNAYFDQNPVEKNTVSIFAPASPIDKIFAERDDLIKHGADMGRATAAALAGASAEIAKEEQDWQKTWTDSVRKGNEEIDKLREEEFQKSTKAADDYAAAWLANLKRNMAQVQQIDERNFTRMGVAETHQERMISLLSEPNTELQALHEQLALREKIRQAELKMKEIHQGVWDLDKERFDAEMDSLRDRYEFEERILEVKKQQTEEVKSAIEPLVHTLFTKPGAFGKQLTGQLRAAALRPLEQGVTNLLTRQVTPLVFGGDGKGGVSSIFRNAFGTSQENDRILLKGATDLNSTVTAANPAAIQSQTAMWQQQMAFQRATNQNLAHAGEVGWTAAVPAALGRGTLAAGATGPMDVLRVLQNSGSSGESVTSTIRFLSEPAPAPSLPTLQSPPVSPHLVLPNLSSNLVSNLVSPKGFATWGDVASLGIPSGLFAARPAAATDLGGSLLSTPTIARMVLPNLFTGNAYSDDSIPRGTPNVGDTLPGPLVTGPAATTSPAPQASAPLVYTPQRPSVWSGFLQNILGGGGQQSTGPFGMLNQLGLGPGGTSGFSGPLGGPTNGGFGLGGPMLNNLRDFVGLSKGGTDLGNGVGVADILHNGTFGQIATSIGKSPAALMGGSMLAMDGLLNPQHAGTWLGIGESTAGGALLGFKFGGPMGAAIGAAAGFAVGGIEKLAGMESPENEAKRLTKQIYGVSIDMGTAHQIVSIADQKYGKHVSLAERSPEVRQLVMLYSEATGQKMPQSATTPHGASLVEQGGKLYQAATYQDGRAYTFQSNLPVAGGYSTGTYPSGPTSVQLIVGAGSAADLFDGRIAQTVTPSYVQDQWSQASGSSYGRLANSAMLQQPGLITS